MKQANKFLFDMLDFDTPDAKGDQLFRAQTPRSVRVENGAVVLEVPFVAQKGSSFAPLPDVPEKIIDLTIRAYGGDIVRLTTAFAGQPPADADSPMIQWHPSAQPETISALKTSQGWNILDAQGRIRMTINCAIKPTKDWGGWDMLPPPPLFDVTVFPDAQVPVPFLPFDTFTVHDTQSIAMGFVARGGQPRRALFSLHAEHDEKFAGTGERFARLDLSGRTILLENADALGVNNRRAYKNVPFYLSSRPYGLFMHTPTHVRLSLADVSTRSAQAVVEEPLLDLFFIGGGTPERILYNYRRITGFPNPVPRWSYGVWMSRMSYRNADQMTQIADRLRQEQFPCDVMNLDGVYKGACDWEFDQDRFPDTAQWLQGLRKKGIRLSAWNYPAVSKKTKHWDQAIKERIIALSEASAGTGSDFAGQRDLGFFDFSNPATVPWFKERIKNLIRTGAALIKTDFGEEIDMHASFLHSTGERMHNIYALHYIKAAWEAIQEETGEGLVWARPAWAGSQRYPLHWAGDGACSWDALAGSLRGGLHLGLSGFAFWSHDVPGFHGVPDFMRSWPDDDLYLRWTQFGVFSSHMRYHGGHPREPYEYPAIADQVRFWLNLRYCLIPYLMQTAAESITSGYPILRAMPLHCPDDPICWNMDDQYFFGADFLVAPIINSAGTRHVYLPEGQWVDFWTGQRLIGPQLLRNRAVPLQRMPLYVRAGASIPVYPEIVQCTDEMDLSKTTRIVFDDTYRGLASSVLGQIIRL